MRHDLTLPPIAYRALAWIAVYDVTGDQQYLSTAESIFEDMKAAYGTTPCGSGGIWWDKAHTYGT